MNSFGNSFRISLWGESHGEAIGVTIDGADAGIALSEDDFTADLNRRRSGAAGTTERRESDLPHILSGTYNGFTTGTPITVVFGNNDCRSNDYCCPIPRPSHADFAASKKWNGYNDPRGGGHLSGRMTLGMVAAGVVAKKMLFGVEIVSRIAEIGGCSDQTEIDKLIAKTTATGDSVGGIIEIEARNVPTGTGEPFFDSVESIVSHILFSIPAVKGVEFGSGFGCASMFGSTYNDVIIAKDGETATNHDGGICGGICNGNPIAVRIAVKPTPSIHVMQRSINMESGIIEDFTIQGRHDACIALRMPVIAEAAVAVALADLMKIRR